MTSERDTAHVLYLDIVGYSLLPMDDQRECLSELQSQVRDTDAYRQAMPGGGLLCLPSGDGMALVFFRDPVAAVQCAVSLSRALRGKSQLKLRMGLHSGPVYRVEDINSQTNVSGQGINIAQRVMDCGEPGHVLLSAAMAELLKQYGDWPLHDLGTCEVKHGQVVHLFNLYGEDFGNPAHPLTILGGSSEGLVRARRAAVPEPGGTRVVLLYKRGRTPDEHVVELLERGLAHLGYEVFVDRHLRVGVPWAREIQRRIEEAHVVIPLLSAGSVESEMLSYEVQLAHDAAQRAGVPRLLPVRVDYSGPLPELLAAPLDALEYALWESPESDADVLTRITDALRDDAGPREMARPKLEPVGGAVPLDSKFYVVRATDEQFLSAVRRRDSIVLVKGARQMGKTSLLARGLQLARDGGARVVLTDFQKLNATHLKSVDTLFLTLAEWIADQLDLDPPEESTWGTRRGPSANFERYLRRHVLAKLDTPLLWGLDEVDRLFSCDFASEVFGLFRSWHNERALDPAAPWSRLTLAIAYATEAHLFITDINQSPFNVGTRLSLADFDTDQVAELNRRYGSPLRDNTELLRFYRLVSGHPYLVRKGLHELATGAGGIDAFESQADRDEGCFGDHLRRILVLLARDPVLEEVVRGVLAGKPCVVPESFYRLRSAGVMTGASMHDMRPRCQLYSTYLRRHLL